MLKHAAIDSCSVENVSFTFFRGLIIKNLSIQEMIDTRRTLHAVIPELTVDYRIFKVIPRWKKSKASLRNRFSNQAYGIKKMGESDDKKKQNMLPVLYHSIIKSNNLLLSCIKVIALKDASISVDSLGRNSIKLSGLDCKVQVNKDDSTRMKIKLSTDTFRNTRLEIVKMRVKMAIDSSQCTVSRIEGNVFNGKMKGAVTLDLQNNRINSGNIELKNIYLERIYRSGKDEKGSMFGRCDMSMKLDPGVADFNMLQGSGTFKMRNVSMNELPALKKFVRLTGLTSLFHLTFRHLQGDFIIRGDRVTSDRIKGEGKPISVSASGWFRQKKGKYNYKVKGVFDAEYKDSIPKIVWNALVPEEKDQRSFFCTVFGDDKSLNISLEKRVMRRAVNNAFKDFSKEIGNIFK